MILTQDLATYFHKFENYVSCICRQRCSAVIANNFQKTEPTTEEVGL